MTPDLILRLDREGRLLFFGSTATPGEIPTLPSLGESIAAWAQTPSDASLWTDAVHRVVETGESVELLVPLQVNGLERFYQGYLSPERQGDAIISLFVVLRDVTPVLRREQELSRQNIALAQTLDAAQKRTLQTLSLEADLSHELRAPLTNIISLLDLLRNSALTSPQAEWVTAARSSSRALLKLINDVLELALIEARRVPLEPAPLSLADLLRDVVVLFARRAQEQNIELIVRIDPAIPTVLYGDAGRIRQVLSNLIDNALKFTPQGYILLDAAKLEETAQRVLLQIEVEDSGAGVPADRRERIFERFAQGTSGNETGSGLGLAISRQLALLMQGSLNYVSRPGTGAVFQLSVPLERGEAIAAPDFRGTLERRGVLVVDSNYLRQCLLYEMAVHWGMQVEVRASLSQMQDVLSRPRHPFDVVLIDDGLSVENLPEPLVPFAKTPYLVLLASPLRETSVTNILPVPLSAVVSKPTFAQTLGETLVHLLAPDAEGEKRERGEEETTNKETEIFDSFPHNTEVIPNPNDPTTQQTRAKRVLIIEDDPVSRKISAGVVEQAGYQVIEAANSAEALERVRDFDFDLILLDVRLPDTDGAALLQQIKAAKPNAVSTRFAFLTAYSLSELPPGLPQDEAAVLVKPLTSESLSNLLQVAPTQEQTTAFTPELKDEVPARTSDGVLPTDGETTAASTDTSETSEVLNAELLWERVGKVSGILRSLIELCKAQWPPLVAEMRNALRSADTHRFLKAAHQMRGMMMSIYATAATEAVRRYEQAVKEGDPAAVLPADAALDAELIRLELALNRLDAETGE